MKLYNLTLQPSTAVIKVLYGNFSEPKAQELILVKSKSIELYSITDKGKLQLIIIEELFCIVRTVVAFRLQGTNKDCLIVGSDSGKLIIVEYNPKDRRFFQTHEETFGKSGCRRIVPGQHIAVDPYGRAIMIAAIEKQKFVYVVAREEDKKIVQSPREAHKSHSICIDVVAMDMGDSNPMFACLEIKYGEEAEKDAPINTGEIQKGVVLYEMDFGINTVVRKKEYPVEASAHMLIPVPGGVNGPGGVLVIQEESVLYRGTKDEQQVRFPIRQGSLRPPQFTSFTTYNLKGFFFLVSSEEGDIFKIQFKVKENKKDVVSIKVQYFDTTSCLSSMALTKNGFLFCAGEKDDHRLFAIVSKDEEKKKKVYTHSQMEEDQSVFFKPNQKDSGELELSDTIEQFGPASDLKVADLRSGGVGLDKNPHVYMLNASGSGKSYLRIIKQGLRIKEISTVKYQKAQNIWSFKNSTEDEFDKLIVISFPLKTIAMALKETGYSQTKDTGIEEASETIHMGKLDDGSLIQVLPSGFRQIKAGSVKPMKLQGKILKASTKGRQMALALVGGDIIFYECNQNNELMEVEQITLDDEVVSMDFSPIPKGKVRSKFLVLGLKDNTVRILDLDAEQCLRQISFQNMKVDIQSVVVEEMKFGTEEDDEKYGEKLYVYTGLANGMLIRTTIDMTTGKMQDSRPKYLGGKAVRCVKLEILGRPAILALSSRPWLVYSYGNKQMISLLAFPYMDIATQIRISSSPHAIIGFTENLMKIISIQSFGQIFHSDKIPLKYSGKKLLPIKEHMAILESDRMIRTQTMSQNTSQFEWKCQISIYDAKKDAIINAVQLEQNETCTAFTYCELKEEQKNHTFLVLACATNLVYKPNLNAENPCIKVYEIVKSNDQVELVFYHKTQIQSIALSLQGWDERILAGVGKCLRAYQIGRKKMLRKAETKSLNSPVNTIKTSGKRIFITEVMDSFHMLKYKAREQTFYDIADDILPRYITTTCLLDDHTIMGADKFENIFVSRVPRNAEEDFENNPNSYKHQWEHGFLTGAPFKLDQICSYYTGEIITSIEKASLATSGAEIIVYSTINGGIGAFCPLDSREDVDFFTHIQIYLRNLLQNISGRDHLNYRSYYSPCKDVIDGDLCEVYMKIPYSEQEEIGKYLDLVPHEIHRRLQEMRNRLI